jgi:hypothetical protein
MSGSKGWERLVGVRERKKEVDIPSVQELDYFPIRQGAMPGFRCSVIRHCFRQIKLVQKCSVKKEDPPYDPEEH